MRIRKRERGFSVRFRPFSSLSTPTISLASALSIESLEYLMRTSRDRHMQGEPCGHVSFSDSLSGIYDYTNSLRLHDRIASLQLLDCLSHAIIDQN
jgi:hypothetical protein